MHLGRRPSRLPSELEGLHGIELAALDPRAAWAAVVERAIELRADAVLLAGDVVDSSNHFMEAYGALHAGVARLCAHGVDVVAVAGNHDVEALPRLADELDGFVLLGRGGRWDTHVVRAGDGGQPLVRVLGWSFPRRHVESSPLDAMPAELRRGRYDDGAPDDLRTVGLLHCDLDGGGGSTYAPVASHELTEHALRVSAWFLGHVHQPSIGRAGRPLGYLGSLVGLDPGELGQRGPWLANSSAGSWQLEQLALSPLLWESMEVDVSTCEDAQAVEVELTRTVRALAREAGSRLDGVRVVGLRLRLVGRTELASEELRRAGRAARDQLQIKVEGVLFFVDKVSDETRPAFDLDALARRDDPLALVARRLLVLQEGGEECRRLVAAARPRFESVAGHANFGPLTDGPPADEAIRDLLLRTAVRALEELLVQKDASPAPAQDEEAHV